MKKTLLISIISLMLLGGCNPKTDEQIDQALTPPASETSSMTEADAKSVAEKSCIKGGEALGAGTYNDITKTWWFDANLNATREGCSPACVVSESTKTAELNWRCTGALETTQ